MVTDDAGTPVSAYSYDAYGAVCAQAGEGRVFTFTGEQTDTETSMVFLRARYYDPQTGRFLSRDSIVPDPTNSQGISRYSYVQGNPLRYTDPSGHFIWMALLAVGGALTAYDVGSSLNTIYLDPNSTPEQRTEAWENLGTYVTAFQAAGPVGEVGGATQGSLRTAGKLAGGIKSLVEHTDEVINPIERGVPIGWDAGKWVRNAPYMSEEARRYQQYVTGAERGWEFLRNGVHFDGISLTSGNELRLLDAKCTSAGAESLYSKVGGLPFAPQKVLREARSQLGAAHGTPVEWHVSDPAAQGALLKLFAKEGISIDVRFTPWHP